ncbi:MAG: NADAR family protein, partial [Myxococcota bacterium]|nr:NADAR family protein [Myxococcota bacterium]
YYQAQKPYPFDADAWDAQRDEVMRVAIRQKFTADDSLRTLLLSTAPHPLLSIKNDHYWGITYNGIGCNRLAVLLMELRETILET